MPASRPQPRPGVLAIEAYVPGKSSAPGVARIHKLSSNETPLGPSPKAIAACRGIAEHLACADPVQRDPGRAVAPRRVHRSLSSNGGRAQIGPRA